MLAVYSYKCSNWLPLPAIYLSHEANAEWQITCTVCKEISLKAFVFSVQDALSP